MSSKTNNQIITEAIEKFGHLPTRTIAKYILYNHGEYFDNNLERIRNILRYRFGAMGDKNRQDIAKLIKRKTPAQLPKTWRRTRTPYHLSPGLWLIVCDPHIPFHEPKPIESMVKYAQKQKINGILYNGDAQDCASISYWLPSMKRDFDRDVVATIDFFDFMDHEFPKAKKVYKPGNHEYRLPRLFQAKVPELMGLPLASMEDVLGFEQRGIEFLD